MSDVRIVVKKTSPEINISFDPAVTGRLAVEAAARADSIADALSSNMTSWAGVEAARTRAEELRAEAEAARVSAESERAAVYATKADKVARATAGNIAALDADGNLIDGGLATADATRAAELSGAYGGVDLAARFAGEIANYADEWAWAQARLDVEDFRGLHPGDYIAVTCENAARTVLKMQIAGINTYKDCGDTATGTHIDWISKDCWPTTIQYNLAGYNNGVGLDKFFGDGQTTVFQLTRRADGAFPALASVTASGVAVALGTDVIYDIGAGTLAFAAAPANAAEILATWETRVNAPFCASNAYAYMNSLKMGVPNEAAAKPALIEVDYTEDGIYRWLPQKVKDVIKPRVSYAASRAPTATLRTASNYSAEANLGNLWLPEEIEVCGMYIWATGAYDAWFSRQYPIFAPGNRRKGAGNNGGRASWWLLNACTGDADTACFILNNGRAFHGATTSTYRVPVCFRMLKS